MSTDFAALSTATQYSTLLTQISDRDRDLARGLDPAIVTIANQPTSTIRYNSANKRWEIYNGSSWVELIVASTDAYAMTVTGVRGGNFYGTITNNGTISGGTVDATTLKQGGSSAWTTSTLTNLNQLTNGPAFITASALSPYAPLASPALTGTPTAPTAAVDTNTTQLATTAYVVGQSYLKSATAASTYAPLASPSLTGVPVAPTAAVDTNTTQLATTAYVIGQGYLKSATAASTYAPIASPTLTGLLTVTGSGGGYAAYINSAASAESARFNSTSDTYVSLSRSGTRKAYLQSHSTAGLLLVNEEATSTWIYSNNAQRFGVGSAGNAQLNAPASGTALAIYALSGTFGLDVQAATGLDVRVYATNAGAKARFFLRGGSTNMSYESDGTPNTSLLFDNGNGHIAYLYTCGASGSWDFRTQGVNRMRIDSTGNIGVNCSPSYRLDVAGTARCSGGVATPANPIGSSGTAFTLDCALSNVHTLTMSGNVASGGWTINNPQDGQTVNLFITQDAGTARTLGWPSAFKWPGTAPAISTTLSAVDLLVMTYRSATGFWYCTLSKAFA